MNMTSANHWCRPFYAIYGTVNAIMIIVQCIGALKLECVGSNRCDQYNIFAPYISPNIGHISPSPSPPTLMRGPNAQHYDTHPGILPNGPHAWGHPDWHTIHAYNKSWTLPVFAMGIVSKTQCRYCRDRDPNTARDVYKRPRTR